METRIPKFKLGDCPRHKLGFSVVILDANEEGYTDYEDKEVTVATGWLNRREVKMTIKSPVYKTYFTGRYTCRLFVGSNDPYIETFREEELV